MARLSVQLLGSLQVTLDGEPVTAFRSDKARALLAYLAVETEYPHRRERLAGLLWPDYPEQAARTNLRGTLANLRHVIGDRQAAPPFLHITRHTVQLNAASDAWIDAMAFTDLLEARDTSRPTIQQLEQAVALYRGDFLEGLSVGDSPPFEEWALLNRERLRRLAMETLRRLANLHEQRGEYEPALEHAWRQVELDPWREGAHRQLMRLLALNGQRAAALAQYESCCRLLAEELGVEPAGETTRLYEQIRDGKVSKGARVLGSRGDVVAIAPAFLSAAPPHPGSPTPFVAREREMGRMYESLEAALEGEGRVMFVIGGAGRGKTALMREFARRAHQAHPDLLVATGDCSAYSGVGDPYLPFRDCLAMLTGDVEARWAAGTITPDHACRLWEMLPSAVQILVDRGPELVGIFVSARELLVRATAAAPGGADWLERLKRLAERVNVEPGGPEQSHLFEQYVNVLRGMAAQRPVLLLLDDLQWADAASISLLFHLGRRIDGTRILVVGAYRPDEVALGRDGAPHPLEVVLTEFKRRFGDVWIDLAQADEREGQRFVHAFLDTAPNRLGEDFRWALFRHTGGHPLFTIELLRHMQERGDLVQDTGGQWFEGLGLAWDVLPARVEGVIERRVGQLMPELGETLSVASVEGEVFTAQVLARVQGIDERQLLQALSRELERRHRLVRELGEVPVGRQRLSRYRFAHALFQQYLYHDLSAGERRLLHGKIGRALEELHSGRTEKIAVQLAHHFRAAGIEEKAIAYLRQAGERAHRQYANQEAIEHFQRALELLAVAPSDESSRDWPIEVATQVHESLGDVLELTGQHDEARRAYRAALAQAPKDDPIRRARLHRKTGRSWDEQSRHEKASRAYEMAEIALGQQPTEAAPDWWQEWLHIQHVRMWLHYGLNQLQEMVELAERTRPVIEEHGTPSQRGGFYQGLTLLGLRQNRYFVSEETLAYARFTLEAFRESGNLSATGLAHGGLGFTYLWRGDLDEAERHMHTALKLAEQTGDTANRARCLTYLTVLHRKRGQIDEVRRYVSRSLAVATTGQMLEYIGMAKANLAWVAWCEGNMSKARENGQAALEMWQQAPSLSPFQWTALFPLIGVALAQYQVCEAIGYARALLKPPQRRLPDALKAIVEAAIRAWETGELDTAPAALDRALELAQEMRYL